MSISLEDRLALWKRAALAAGVCPTCVEGCPDPWGCSDCLNTGWSGGDPYKRADAAVERMAEAEICLERERKDHRAEARRFAIWNLVSVMGLVVSAFTAGAHL